MRAACASTTLNRERHRRSSPMTSVGHLSLLGLGGDGSGLPVLAPALAVGDAARLLAFA
jgi:hypothetical protein